MTKTALQTLIAIVVFFIIMITLSALTSHLWVPQAEPAERLKHVFGSAMLGTLIGSVFGIIPFMLNPHRNKQK